MKEPNPLVRHPNETESKPERIFNFTQHILTADQLRDGVEELSQDVQTRVRELMTFHELPTTEQL